MRHLDLFSGIGGFAYAIDQVWDNVEHVFCDNEPFCQAVLRKHWPESEIYGDIRSITEPTRADILTGGFPCQPFSQAGKRKGTNDNRYLWPEMLRVIRLTKPQWVVAENVGGLITWNDGMVLEQVCSDLESEGYEVQPLIIPACAVNAPHRRDRIWIIANAKSNESDRTQRGSPGKESRKTPSNGQENDPSGQSTGTVERIHEDGEPNGYDGAIADPRPQRRSQGSTESIRPSWQEPEQPDHQHPSWERNWKEVAFTTCNDAMDDGLPRIVDGVSISRARWRKESLKAYGNAIVPQVAIQIMKAIKEAQNDTK